MESAHSVTRSKFMDSNTDVCLAFKYQTNKLCAKYVQYEQGECDTKDL